jgi:alpha-1,2-mannosyltransferase
VSTRVVAGQARSGSGQRQGKTLLTVGAAVAGASVVAYLITIAMHPWHDMLKGFDLQVYLDGGRLALHHPDSLYSWSWQGHAGIKFTYTPFAALLFAAGTAVPFRALMTVAALASVASLAATVWIAFRELGWRRAELAGPALLLGGLALWLEPVQRALYLGQVELVLMAMITADMCASDRRWWKGAATGLAAGIKLVPALFIVYLLLTRRLRAAAVAIGAFAVTVVIGFVFLPHDSAQWWFHDYFFEAGRTGFVGAGANQSLRGLLTRLAGSVSTGQAIWWAVAIVVGVAGLAAATMLHRRGQQFAGLMTCALTALLISPISWDHHWVWVVPFLAVAVTAAVRAGSVAVRAWWLAGAAAVALIFAYWPKFWTHPVQMLQGGLIYYAPAGSYEHGDHPWFPEYHWHGVALIAGNLYVLAGCAMFIVAVAAAVALGRRRGAA